jgi:hypothetical protein
MSTRPIRCRDRLLPSTTTPQQLLEPASDALGQQIGTNNFCEVRAHCGTIRHGVYLQIWPASTGPVRETSPCFTGGYASTSNLHKSRDAARFPSYVEFVFRIAFNPRREAFRIKPEGRDRFVVAAPVEAALAMGFVSVGLGLPRGRRGNPAVVDSRSEVERADQILPVARVGPSCPTP